jgi:hypothetical protein
VLNRIFLGEHIMGCTSSKPISESTANNSYALRQLDAEASNKVKSSLGDNRLSKRQQQSGQLAGLSSLNMSSTEKLRANTSVSKQFRLHPIEGYQESGEPLRIAEEVLEQVRKTFYKPPNFKSSNKARTLVDREQENARINNAYQEIGQWRATLPAISHHDLIDKIKRSQGHNCGELALLAVDSLLARGANAVKIGIGGDANTHGFAAIMPMDGVDVLSRDMKNWSNNIIICDPWMNIVCPAPKFPELFLEKMDKWAKAGKLVNNGKAFIDANNKKWTDSIINGEKMVNYKPSDFFAS